MTDIAALEAQKKTILDTIATLSTDVGRQLPMRKLPSNAAAKVTMLNRQLAVINLKLQQAAKAANASAT